VQNVHYCWNFASPINAVAAVAIGRKLRNLAVPNFHSSNGGNFCVVELLQRVHRSGEGTFGLSSHPSLTAAESGKKIETRTGSAVEKPTKKVLPPLSVLLS